MCLCVCVFLSFCVSVHIVRPPYIHVGRLMFYHGFHLLHPSSFLSATVRARWMELNQNWPHARKWVRFENACPKSGVSHPAQIGGPKSSFWPLLSLMATLMACVFGRKHYINKRASALATIRVSYIASKRHELWSTNGFKLDVSFHVYPT